MYLPVLQFGKPHAQRQTRGVADVSAKRTVVEYASAQQSRGRDLYQSSHNPFILCVPGGIEVMHDIDERLCQLFFQVLYLFRLPLLRLHQVDVLTLSRLSMFTMTCLGAAEDNRPVPE